MSKADRQHKRRRRNKAINAGSRLFKEALKEAEKVEAGIKEQYNKLPIWHRFWCGFLLTIGRWK
jgi:hypothetical protein